VEEDDVLELTERLDGDAAPVESVGDLDVFSAAPAAAPEPAPPPVAAAPPLAAAPAPALDDEGLLSAPAASSAASAFASLSGAIGMPRDGRTLEDVVRELLRPLLKQWLDENLPRIVETAVQAEVERVSRRGSA
jgi:cell pole-organizing protein PopZ